MAYFQTVEDQKKRSAYSRGRLLAAAHVTSSVSFFEIIRSQAGLLDNGTRFEATEHHGHRCGQQFELDVFENLDEADRLLHQCGTVQFRESRVKPLGRQMDRAPRERKEWAPVIRVPAGDRRSVGKGR